MKSPAEILRLIRENAASFLADAKSDPLLKRYLLIAAGMFLFFFLLVFPYNAVVMSVLKKGEGAAYRSLTLSGLDVSLLFGFSADELHLTTKGNEEIRISGLDSGISPLRIMLKSISGSLVAEKFSYVSSKIIIQGKLTAESDFSISGESGLPDKGTLNLSITSGLLDGLKLMDFKIPAARIGKMDLQLNFTNAAYEIKKGIITGTELKGAISGRIVLNRQNFNASTLDLKMEFDPASPLFKEYEMFMGMLTDKGTGKVTLRIGGTVMNPEFKPGGGS
jgi:hypothetical protein